MSEHDYDRECLERATFADREAAQLDCVRPTLRWYVVREAGEPVARVRAFTAEAAVYCVTYTRRKDGLSTTALSAVQDAGNDQVRNSVAKAAARV